MGGERINPDGQYRRRHCAMTDEFILTTPTRSGRRGKPVKQTKVFVTAEGIAAVRAGRMTGEHLIARSGPERAGGRQRHVAAHVGSIRSTDRKSWAHAWSFKTCRQGALRDGRR